MGKSQNVLFLFFLKHTFEQFVIPSKKKLKADRHTADVERGFSAQNLICTSQKNRLTIKKKIKKNQDMFFGVQFEAPREVKGQSEWDVTKVKDKWHAKRKRMLFSRGEEEQTQWWFG